MKRLVIAMLLLVASPAMFAQTHEKTNHKKERSAKVTYICRTHPEVVSATPGICAKCNKELVADRKGSKQVTALYRCSMDTNVVSNEPGKCPKCDMALEKKNDNSKSKM
jgi:Cu(I)/Ag(I) efflux system membrane fusion protein